MPGAKHSTDLREKGSTSRLAIQVALELGPADTQPVGSEIGLEGVGHSGRVHATIRTCDGTPLPSALASTAINVICVGTRERRPPPGAIATAAGLPIQEYPQTVGNTTQMGQALFDLLNGRNRSLLVLMAVEASAEGRGVPSQVLGVDYPRPVAAGSGDEVSVRISARLGTNDDGRCAGPGGSHSSATGLRLYYDSASRASRVDLEIIPSPLRALYLHSDGSVCGSAESAPSRTGFSTATRRREPTSSARTRPE